MRLVTLRQRRNDWLWGGTRPEELEARSTRIDWAAVRRAHREARRGRTLRAESRDALLRASRALLEARR